MPLHDLFLRGSREKVIESLHAELPELRDRLGVISLTLFESTARGDAREDSDVDVLDDLGPDPTCRRLLAVIDRPARSQSR